MEKFLSKINDQSDIISLMDMLFIIAKRIKIILIIPFIFCTITIINVTFFSSPTYLSSSKIKSSTNNDQTSSAFGIAAQFGIHLPTSTNQKWVYPEILKSRTMARKMLKQRFDTDEFGPQKTLLQILTYGNEEPNYGKDTLEILAIENFLTMIKIDENLKTAIITPDAEIIDNPDKINPAYIVFENYELILKWNRSLRFALAVCTLKNEFKNAL